MEKKYGLQLRVNPSQPKKPVSRPPLPNPLGFNGGNSDDEDDVEREISRQAYKNKSLRDIEEQHKKALEEDPSVFDYDGVYDDMKLKVARPLQNDRQERKPKYIQMLVEKAKIREKEQEIVYERKIAKERSKEDHLYAGKDKYVTSAYKKKLAERDKWAEEQRRRDMLEEKNDVTKKTDITDFYFNLAKNVAFGAEDDAKLKKPEKKRMDVGAKSAAEETSSSRKPQSPGELPSLGKIQSEKSPEELDVSRKTQPESPKSSQRHENGNSLSPREETKQGEATRVSEAPPQEVSSANEPETSKKPNIDHHKRTQDALAAAKERFLARKKAKEQ